MNRAWTARYLYWLAFWLIAYALIEGLALVWGVAAAIRGNLGEATLAFVIAANATLASQQTAKAIETSIASSRAKGWVS